MYPGIAPSFDYDKNQTESNTTTNSEPKSRPEQPNHTPRPGSVSRPVAVIHTASSRLWETPGTLRDNEVDAPLESGEPCGARTDPNILPIPIPASEKNANVRPESVDTTPIDAMLMPASDFIGRPVCNPEGVPIGTICELMISARTGAVSFALISVANDFAATGKALTSLPWKSLRLNREDGSMIYDAFSKTN